MWLSLVLSRWGAINVLKPQPTKNKVGSSLSWLSPPPPLWCCLFRPVYRAIICSEQFFCSVLLFFPWWPSKARQVEKAASSLAVGGSGGGPARLGRCFGVIPVSSGLMRKKWWRDLRVSFFCFEEGELGAPASSSMAGILIARDTHFPPAA